MALGRRLMCASLGCRLRAEQFGVDAVSERDALKNERARYSRGMGGRGLWGGARGAPYHTHRKVAMMALAACPAPPVPPSSQGDPQCPASAQQPPRSSDQMGTGHGHRAWAQGMGPEGAHHGHIMGMNGMEA